MAPGRKTGGRITGISKNKPKPIRLPDTEENRALALMAPTAEVRTPKAVMLSAMLKFERMSDVLMGKAQRMTQTRADPGGIAKIVAEAHKFTIAAVQCAEKVAPYIHARLLSVESRGDMADKAPFVIRAPAVMEDSSAWQAAVGAAVIDMEAASVPSGGQPEVLAHPAQQQAAPPQNAPADVPVVLVPDPKTSRITVMPPGPRVVQPFGNAEWLDRVEQERRRANGS
jgi:hypothetical protein